jgi:hypothetical protein
MCIIIIIIVMFIIIIIIYVYKVTDLSELYWHMTIFAWEIVSIFI